MNDAPPLALTMGDPAGIGPEIAARVWRERTAATPAFVYLGDPDQIAALCPVIPIDDPAKARAAFPQGLPVMAVPLTAPAVPGAPDPRNAPAVIAAIDRAADLALKGRVSGVVTNPIHKAGLYAAGFTDPGHTEYLARITGAKRRPVMMLAVPGLRVVPATIHIALADVPAALSVDLLVETGAILAEALARDFMIDAPRIAVAGLNPHAGEGGAMGGEEARLIAPAITALRARGIAVTGPHPADTLFHAAVRARYDAALCLYHDQALIPIKTIDFDHGVNVTLGLDIVRASPDHGTAFDIAGMGRANPASLAAAIDLAAAMAKARASRPAHGQR